MVTRATKEQIWEYKDSQAVSQSYLKDVVMKGKSTSSRDTDGGMGSVVDAYLTLPDHIDDFFTAFSGNVPSDALREVLTNAMVYLLEKNRLTHDLLRHKETVLKQTEYDDFDQKKKAETRWNSIVDKAKHWWEFTADNIGKGKEVVTPDDISIGMKIGDMAKEHPVSRHFFNPLEGRDYYYQKAIYFTYLGVKCKALLDILVVSHTKRKVVITDLKTIFDAQHEIIALQIKKYQYPIQPSFYEVAVETILEELGAVGYQIETNWLFVPKNIQDGGAHFTPVVWPCTASMKHWARYGGAILSSRSYVMEDAPFRDKPSAHTIEPVQQVMGWEVALLLYKNCMETGVRTFKKKEKLISSQDADRLYFS